MKLSQLQGKDSDDYFLYTYEKGLRYLEKPEFIALNCLHSNDVYVVKSNDYKSLLSICNDYWGYPKDLAISFYENGNGRGFRIDDERRGVETNYIRFIGVELDDNQTYNGVMVFHMKMSDVHNIFVISKYVDADYEMKGKKVTRSKSKSNKNVGLSALKNAYKRML